MSIKINGQSIAGRVTPSSYRAVGEIFYSLLPLSDPKVHLLDGSTVSRGEGFGAFVDKIKELTSSYPQIACTQDAFTNSLNSYGVCGKFVVVDSNTIRLPKISGFVEGVNSVSDLGKLTEEGLPNITGQFGNYAYGASFVVDTYQSGALYRSGTARPLIRGESSGSGSYLDAMSIDASRSSSIYGKSTHVQPQSVGCLAYIVLASGVVSNLNRIDDYTLNNPFFYGDKKFAPKNLPISNASWIKADGSWIDGDVYKGLWDWALSNLNASNSLFTSDTASTDLYKFIIDTTNKKLKLPIYTNERILITKKENDSSRAWYNLYSDGFLEQGGFIQTPASSGTAITFPFAFKNTQYQIMGSGTGSTAIGGTSVANRRGATAWIKDASTGYICATSGTENSTTSVYWMAIGYHTNTKADNTLYDLYWYVGETLNQANLIQYGELARKINNTSSEGIQDNLDDLFG